MTRLLLVLLCIAILSLVLWAMLRGWRNRIARQADLPALPAVPDELGDPLLVTSGLYVGTTFASSWQDRILHDRLGERADADAILYPSGLLLVRQGSAPIFVPADAWISARLAPGLAGKVVGEGGLLTLRWHFGEVEVDTAFRADDKSAYPQWVRTINGSVKV